MKFITSLSDDFVEYLADRGIGPDTEPTVASG